MVASKKDEHFSIVRVKKLNGSTSKDFVMFAQGDKAFHPPEERLGIVLLQVYIDRFVVEFRINNDWEIEFLRIPIGEPGIAIAAQ